MGLLLPPLLPSSRSELGHDPKTAFHQGGGERTRTADFYVANVAVAPQLSWMFGRSRWSAMTGKGTVGHARAAVESR
jgi:hypothetical protein